jgi:DUF1009 family protein
MALAEAGAPLVILAGGGDLPARVAAAATAAGRPVLILAIEGEAGPSVESFPHHWVKWGELGRLESLTKQHGARDIVLVGKIVHRPSLKTVRLDALAIRSLPKLIGLFSGGDHSVLSVVIRFIEGRGFHVVGPHEIAGDLVAEPGVLTEQRPSDKDLRDLDLGFRAAIAIGKLDAGQAAVALNEHIVALEGLEGTDAMIDRVGALREAGKVFERGRAGVVVKCAKPQQDLRIDMPTIGPHTVDRAAAANLAGIGIEAGRVIIVDRDTTLRKAREAGLFIVARTADDPHHP